MKTFIALVCFALVAVTLAEDSEAPHSIGGSLLRAKSNILSNAADRVDRWVYGLKRIIPFGLVNASSSTTAAPTTTTASTSTTTTPPERLITIACDLKTTWNDKLTQIDKNIATAKADIGDATTGKQKAYDDAETATVGKSKEDPTFATRDAARDALYKAKSDLAKLEGEKVKITEIIVLFKDCP